MDKYEAPIYKIEVTVPKDSYIFLNEKAEDFSSSVEDLANTLFKKSYLELELLTPTVTKEALNYEVQNLEIFKELYKREFENKEPEEKASTETNTILLYDRLLNIGLKTFSNVENNFNLLKRIFDFNYNKEILLEVISAVKNSDYTSTTIPEELLAFEDYVKEL